MSEPIRVLHVFHYLNRGGAETFIMNVYRNIDRSKVQFDFMLHTTEKCSYDDEVAELGGKIFRVPSYTVANHMNYKAEWQDFFCNNKTHRIIHGHMTSTAAIYLKIAKGYGLITVAHAHTTSSGKGFSAVVKYILQIQLKYITDILYACSREAGEWCYGKNISSKPNFRIIKNAIDIEAYLFSDETRKRIREELGIEGRFVVGHVGRFSKPKNHEFLIEIFSEIHQRNKDTVLLLVGDGDLRATIESKVIKLGLNDCVVFTGVRSDIPDLLFSMDVFLFPSLWEGLPVTLIEAQTSSLNCIISDCITSEVQITDMVTTISLNEPAVRWAEKVLSFLNAPRRINMKKEIKNAGFDIRDISEWLQNSYIGAIKNE